MKSLIGIVMADYFFALSVPVKTESVCVYFLIPVFYGILAF